MKKILLLFTIAVSVISCQKKELPQTDPTLSLLKQNLKAEDFSNLDVSTISEFTSRKTGSRFVRAGFNDKDRNHDFVMLVLDKNGNFSDGKIIHVDGKIGPSLKSNGKQTFNGILETSSLKHTDVVRSSIKEGFITALHESKVSLNGVGVNQECSDCTIPEVVVSTSYNKSGGISWGAWMSFLSMFGQGDPYEYLLIDYVSSGGGGGGSTPPPAISVDEEIAENKEKIDPKKYMDCFGNVPDAGATCTITISADLPVDGHPEILFDWSQGNPGHAFIELYKMGSNGTLVSQNIGFYPSTGFKVLGGGDVNSKVVDNAGHEYNASYTISISPAQLQAAIDKVNSFSGNSYNMTNFNCVDFALGVFNAATAGGLSVTKQQIPGYPTTDGSNTPQAVYNRLDEMKAWGTPGIQTSGSKAYGGTSKGPCN